MSLKDDWSLEPQLTLRVPLRLYRGLEAYAHRCNITKQEALLTAALALIADDLSAEERDQLQAEATLMAFVQRAAEDAASADWDEDVVLGIFCQIAARDDLRAAYMQAIGLRKLGSGNPDKARIDRNIGKRIKSALGAEDLLSAGIPQRGSGDLEDGALSFTYPKLRRRKPDILRSTAQPRLTSRRATASRN